MIGRQDLDSVPADGPYVRPMKLHVTLTSPYARMARIVMLEKRLEARVEILVARTRVSDSPYYAVNPSGRVPYLICDDGTGLEDSGLICAYLDHLDGEPAFDPPDFEPKTGAPGLDARRLEAMTRSLLDGLAVWGRELARPADERSPTIIAHETARGRRMADHWEQQIEHPWMQGPFNMAQMTLICALQLEIRNPDLVWRPDHPKLSAWTDALATRPSLAATLPPQAN